MKGLQLSVDNIRGLAKQERDIDAGTQPFVVYSGHRWPFSAETLAHLGMESGQTVTHVLLDELMQVNILNLTRKIERQG